MDIRLEMKGITKQFPGVRALDNFSFDVRAGEVHALAGENGAGKSTLMKILYGVYRPEQGEIFIDGKKVEIGSASEASKLGIGVVFQELNICPHLDVANNVFLGRMKSRWNVIDDRTAIEETKKVLSDTIRLDVDPTRLVRTLSIAEQQMVEIAKVVSRDSRIIVFDEPTSSLTDNEIVHLFEIIRNLKKQGVGIVYISHRLEELDQIADRVTVMRDGKHVKTMNYSDVSKEELVHLMVNREMKEQFPDYQRKIGEVIFSVDGIRRDDKLDVEHLDVRRGEIIGLAGLVGAGRTEAMKAVFGCYPANIRKICINGKEMKKFRSPREAINAGFVYITEDRKKEGLALGLSVEENINMAVISKVAKYGVVNEKKADQNADDYVSRLAIKTPGIFQKAQFLSGGNQQKVILAKWLLSDMKILVFDEPTRGIDVGAKYDIYEIMNQLSDLGIGIIMISSELPEIIGMSDRVFVFRQGKAVAELKDENINADTIMQYATGVSGQQSV